MVTMVAELTLLPHGKRSGLNSFNTGTMAPNVGFLDRYVEGPHKPKERVAGIAS